MPLGEGGWEGRSCTRKGWVPGTGGYLGSMSMGDRVDEGIKVEGWEVRVLGLDVYHRRGVVPWQVHMIWQ